MTVQTGSTPKQLLGADTRPGPAAAVLRGVTVLEAIAPGSPHALRLAAGLCGRMAADLGADVTVLRHRGDEREHAHFLQAGKRQVWIGADRFREAALDLTVRSAAAVLDPLAQDYALRSPDTVCVMIGMSADAPNTGTEFTIEARSGLLDLVGDPARQPLRLGGHQTAHATGLAAYLAMIGALIARGHGTGPMRVNMLDVAVWLNWKSVAAASRTGKSPTREGRGSEWTAVPCADGFVAIVYRGIDWERLTKALGSRNPNLLDPDFASAAVRKSRRVEVNNQIAIAVAGLSRSDLRTLSIEYRLPLGPVWSPSELMADEHMQAREFFQSYEGPGRLARLPAIWRDSGAQPSDRLSAEAIFL